MGVLHAVPELKGVRKHPVDLLQAHLLIPLKVFVGHDLSVIAVVHPPGKHIVGRFAHIGALGGGHQGVLEFPALFPHVPAGRSLLCAPVPAVNGAEPGDQVLEPEKIGAFGVVPQRGGKADVLMLPDGPVGPEFFENADLVIDDLAVTPGAELPTQRGTWCS